MVKETTLTAESVRAEHAQLYAAYCEFKTDAVRSLLAGERGQETIWKIRSLGRVMGMQEFLDKLLSLANHPQKYHEFRDIMLAGWQSGALR